MTRKAENSGRRTRRDEARVARLEAVAKQQRPWQNCGVYSTPVHNENAVHSLEHGAMWITYRTGLAAPELARLLKDASGQPYALVSPYPGLRSPIVASAWGVELKLSSASDPRRKAFVETFKSGTQAPEPGGGCTGGVGTRKADQTWKTAPATVTSGHAISASRDKPGVLEILLVTDQGVLQSRDDGSTLSELKS